MLDVRPGCEGVAREATSRAGTRCPRPIPNAHGGHAT